MNSFIAVLLGFFTGFMKTATKILELVKEKQFQATGRKLEQAEQAKDEVEVTRKQTEILIEDRKKSDTIKRLEDGTF